MWCIEIKNNIFNFRKAIVEIENEPERNGESETILRAPITIAPIADIGHDLRNAVKLSNEVLKSLIATTLLTSVVSLALGLYVVIATITLYNKTDTSGLNIFSALVGCMCCVFFVRLYFLISSGQTLCNQMKEGKHNLEEYRLEHFENLKENMEVKYKMDLLQQRLGGESPIIPYSIFGLSNFTFMRFMVAIIGYIVVLIKMRGVKMPNNELFSKTPNDELFSTNASNLTLFN